MLSVHGRKPAAVVVEPVAKALLAIGLTPNTITVVSAALTIAASVILIPTGHLFAAAIVTGLFAAFDMIDGTMARLKGGGTCFGATLDASCDRITDGALFSAIVYWLVYVAHASRMMTVLALIVLVASQVISYVKARGEASGFTMVGGLIERPERLIIGLVGLGLTGLGIGPALGIALWILAIGSCYTVVQRLVMAKHDTKAQKLIAPPPGAPRVK